MNPNIQQLFKIANKKTRYIIGLMSGTSVDGLDVAVCKITGNGNHTKINIVAFETVTYKPIFKEKVASIFSKRNVDLEAVCLINEWIGVQHGTIILQCLKKWNINPKKIDCIASHGQTIYHAPTSLHKNKNYSNGTLQIGDGDHIAVTTGIITISDFRQKHIAAGGEGAPLAVYGDYLMFGKKGENRVMLNIGGIANFTYLPATLNINEVFSTDVGPGNTIMDAYMKKHFKKDYDDNGSIASKGTVHLNLLKALKNNSFFKKKFPKTTGPEMFNLDYLTEAQKASNTENISQVDCMRTLNQFSADTIAGAILKSFANTKNIKIYSSGGGMHNPILMQNIKSHLPNATFYTTYDLAINPDAKEAVLFAILANETLVGNNKNFKTNRIDIPSVSMGKISFPC
jgi:anhydro-N-acetylmuramic acid kinase